MSFALSKIVDLHDGMNTCQRGNTIKNIFASVSTRGTRSKVFPFKVKLFPEALGVQEMK